MPEMTKQAGRRGRAYAACLLQRHLDSDVPGRRCWTHHLLTVGDATQSPADVMEYSAVSEVLDADYDAAGTCSEDLYVHAFNPVCPALHPNLRGHLQHSHHLCTATA